MQSIGAGEANLEAPIARLASPRLARCGALRRPRRAARSWLQRARHRGRPLI